jgi:signal transduction histidine kinase
LIISSISHGIKGLLTSLDGGIYLVNTGLAKNDRIRFEQGWKMVERNIARIRRMVLDLLYYAKDRVPELEKTSAPALAGEVCEVMRGKATELGIDFKCRVDDKAGECDVDPKAVRTLLINLVENAIDACRVDKKKTTHELSIGLKGYPEHIEFDVTDNGIGMDQETRERAFTLFFSSKRGSGTGLGLFISNKIAQAHGGEIKIESELNKGTRMIVKLPRKPPVSKTEAPKV